MTRQEAIRMLKRMIGKNFGFKVIPGSPDRDVRAEATSALPDVRQRYADVKARQEARYKALLDGDEEYQRLTAESRALSKQCEHLRAQSHTYRFNAYQREDWHWVYLAGGDTWEEVQAVLEYRRNNPGVQVFSIDALREVVQE